MRWAQGTVRRSIPQAVEAGLGRVSLGLPAKAAIVAATLSYLLLVGSSDIERFGPLAMYLYGSIPFAFLFSRLLSGRDVSEEGSTNVGVANSFNVAGKAAGALTVAGEASKGLLPVVISYVYFGYSLEVACFLLVGALLGTNFSIFLKGKGGMGTTMMLWSMLFLSPLALLVLLVALASTLLLMKDKYMAALLDYTLPPIIVLVADGRPPLFFLALFAACIFVLKYRRHMDDFQYRGTGARAPRRAKEGG